MTKNSDFKKLVRRRMLLHGESFTQARQTMLDRSTAPDEPANSKETVKLKAFIARTLRTFMSNGTLTAIPTKRKALVVVLLEILPKFERGRIYAESQVNDLLGAYHPDFARLRRELVDYRFLVRDRTGRRYWVNEEPVRRTGNTVQEVAGLVN